VEEFRICPGRVTKIVDADTVDCEISLGYHVLVNERLRLCKSNGVGLNAPEVRGEEREAGLAATAFLKELLEKHAPDGKVIVRSFKAKQGKYGRFICSLEVRRSTGGMIYICDLLVAAGHAVEKEY